MPLTSRKLMPPASWRIYRKRRSNNEEANQSWKGVSVSLACFSSPVELSSAPCSRWFSLTTLAPSFGGAFKERSWSLESTGLSAGRMVSSVGHPDASVKRWIASPAPSCATQFTTRDPTPAAKSKPQHYSNNRYSDLKFEALERCYTYTMFNIAIRRPTLVRPCLNDPVLHLGSYFLSSDASRCI